MEKTEVCLVELPFSLFTMPSFSLSLLKGCLNRAGIRSEVLYGSMRFSLRDYDDYIISFRRLPQQICLGDAVFAEVAWERPMAVDYVAMLREQGIYAPFLMAAAAKAFARLQKEAGPFIEELGELIIKKQPKIVAMSSMFCQNNACIALARYLKRKMPSVVTMVGGANAVGETAWGLAKCPGCFDYVFSGEADEIFAEVCARVIKDGAIPVAELPYGVLTREMELDGKPVPVRHTADLNEVPYPDYDDYFAQLQEFGLTDKLRPAIFMEFSRGCWWNMFRPCTFCGLNSGNHKYRIKRSGRVLAELDYLLARYGVRRIMVTDNILSPIHLKEIMPAIGARKEKLYFFGEVKTNLSDREIKGLAKAGFTHLQPGIESLQDEVLEIMNKGATGIHQIAFLKRLMNVGIDANWNILGCFPWEKPEYYEEMAEIIPLITHYMAPRIFTPVVFSRSSVYLEQPEAYGLKLKPYRFYEPCFPDEEFRRLTAVIYQPSGEKEAELQEDISKVSPAHERVKKLADYWLAASMSSPERLTVSEKDGALEVMDMRRVAVSLFYTLDGEAEAVARAADKEIKREALVEMLSGRFERADIEAKIDWLIEMKLLLQMRGELLFLPTWADAPAYPPAEENPRGYLYEIPELRAADCEW